MNIISIIKGLLTILLSMALSAGAAFHKDAAFSKAEELKAVLDALSGSHTGFSVPESIPQAYIVHVVDQNTDPVPEVMVAFCTDTSCIPAEADETGTISFAGEPYEYHLQIVDVPDGYSYDENFEMYTTPEYSEWVLQVKKTPES